MPPVSEADLRWPFTSLEDELLSLNLLKAHRACEARLRRNDLVDGIAEVSDQTEYRIGCIASAVIAKQYSAAFEQYCYLYSMLYMVVPLGNALAEPASFHQIRHLDAAYLVQSAAPVWVAPFERFDPCDFWTERASGSAGYLQTSTINAVMRMQLAKLLTTISGMNFIVEFCFAQTYESMEWGLQQFITHTLMRLEQGSVPFVHFDLGHTCVALHRGLTEAKSLAIPIVGGSHFRILLIDSVHRTLFWHDPFGNGAIHAPIRFPEGAALAARAGLQRLAGGKYTTCLAT